MDGRKAQPLVKPVPSTTKVMIYWLTRANISVADRAKWAIVLKLLKKCPLLYAFLGALFQESPRANLLKINNITALNHLTDFDSASTLAAIRTLDNAGKLTQHAFDEIIQHPGIALFTANKLKGVPDEKDKTLIKHFVELRKCTRTLSQGNRTETGEFFKLPIEIWLKILKQTCRPSTLSKKVIYSTIIKALDPISITRVNTSRHR